MFQRRAVTGRHSRQRAGIILCPQHHHAVLDLVVAAIDHRKAFDRALAIGLATDEPECRVPNEWKRHNLIAAGADYIVPNYLCRQALLPTLFANHEPI